uniref:Uncharacterized protein n=1 Tax=Siphoviridae sp. ctS2049 TaxID=2825507 RepID=A0A8S5V8R3_9CAUD|nr:MAG TPA: hypothetical protein [Siphoviridae sp. ctS2049]
MPVEKPLCSSDITFFFKASVFSVNHKILSNYLTK